VHHWEPAHVALLHHVLCGRQGCGRRYHDARSTLADRRPGERKETMTYREHLITIGLSLTALSPAAAWYFIFLVYRFFAPPGEKTIYKQLKMTGKRKS
jgi:hypothetical protein